MRDRSTIGAFLVSKTKWILLVKPLLLSLLIFVGASACMRRSRLNSNCEWAHDSAQRLDLNQVTDEHHLIDDVELAEELGIRYRDSFRRQHGMQEEHRRTVECTATLLDQIAHIHSVPAEEILKARQRRPANVDAIALLSFAIFFCLVSSRLIAGLLTRFPADEPTTALGAI